MPVRVQRGYDVFLSSVSLQQKLTVLEEAILRVLQVTLKT